MVELPLALLLLASAVPADARVRSLLEAADNSRDVYQQTAALELLARDVQDKDVDRVVSSWKRLLGQREQAVQKHLQHRRLTRLRTAREQLTRSRREALALIFDEKKYVNDKETGNKGQEAQPWIDRHVLAVTKIWETRSSPVRLGTAFDRDVALLEVTVRLGFLLPLEKTEQSLRSLHLGYYRSLAGRTLTVKTFGLTWQEQLQIDYGEHVLVANPQVIKQNPRIATSRELEQLRLMNEYRRLMGVHPLLISDKLIVAARRHSEVMRNRGVLSHHFDDHPLAASHHERIKAAGFVPKRTGENIAQGYPTPERVNYGWYTSSGHHRNMLDPRWTHAGIGESEAWWTQTFASASIQWAPKAKLVLEPHIKKLAAARAKLLAATFPTSEGKQEP